MKTISIKALEIFTDGSLNFCYKSLNSSKQIIFYEKDYQSSGFSKKLSEKQTSYNSSHNLYKSKYKIFTRII